MRLIILTITVVTLISSIEAVSPEEWSEKTYDFVHNFKGTKQQFYAAMTKRLLDDMKTMKPGTMTMEKCIKGVNLTAEKLTDGDIVTAAEFKGYFDGMLKKFPMPH